MTDLQHREVTPYSCIASEGGNNHAKPPIKENDKVVTKNSFRADVMRVLLKPKYIFLIVLIKDVASVSRHLQPCIATPSCSFAF